MKKGKKWKYRVLMRRPSDIRNIYSRSRSYKFKRKKEKMERRKKRDIKWNRRIRSASRRWINQLISVLKLCLMTNLYCLPAYLPLVTYYGIVCSHVPIFFCFEFITHRTFSSFENLSASIVRTIRTNTIRIDRVVKSIFIINCLLII